MTSVWSRIPISPFIHLYYFYAENLWLEALLKNEISLKWLNIQHGREILYIFVYKWTIQWILIPILSLFLLFFLDTKEEGCKILASQFMVFVVNFIFAYVISSSVNESLTVNIYGRPCLLPKLSSWVSNLGRSPRS